MARVDDSHSEACLRPEAVSFEAQDDLILQCVVEAPRLDRVRTGRNGYILVEFAKCRWDGYQVRSKGAVVVLLEGFCGHLIKRQKVRKSNEQRRPLVAE